MFRARVYRLISSAGGSLMLYGHQGQTWRLEEYWRLRQTFHVFGPVLIGALLLALPDLALANWWIVRASDKQCLVLDIEPPGKDERHQDWQAGLPHARGG